MSYRYRARRAARDQGPHEPRLVAYDYSGSTEMCDFYHETVRRVVKDYEPYDVILWDNELEVSNARSLKQINRQRDGRGGTQPIVVARHVVSQGIVGQLILITDGQILPRHVEELDNFLSANPMGLSSVECFLIQTAEGDKLDATVIAPFIRRLPHRVMMYGLNSRTPVVIASGGGSEEELITEIRSIRHISEFQAKFEHLFTEIVAKMLGKTEDQGLREEILRLQKRLLNEMKSLPEGFDGDSLRSAFSGGDVDGMVSLAGELFRSATTKWSDPTWPPQLFHLLRMCTGNLGSVYSLSALGSRFQANRVRRAEVVENFELSEVQVLEGDGAFMCPISYEEEADVVILVKKPGEGLLAGESAGVANSIITNPLNALSYPDFCCKLVSHMDHPIALRSMKEAEEAGFPITTSPLTRASVFGGLFLGAGEEHSRATNFTIAHLITEGKRVGNADLWFMLLWWLIERGHAHHLDSVLPQIRGHLAFRLHAHLGTFTMMNSPYLPITLVPLGIAAWCTLSAIAYGAPEDQAIKYLNCHSGHVEVLEQAVGLVGYSLPPAAVDLLGKWRMFGEIRSAIGGGDDDLRKWAVRSVHRVMRLDRSAIRCELFRRVVDEVPIDGEPPAAQVEEALGHLPRWFVDLSKERRRSVARMLEFTDASGISYRDFDREVPTMSWSYGVRELEIPSVPICRATCRPFYVDPAKQVVWHEASRGVFGEVHNQIHIHWYFIECVNKLKVFPSKEEFILFVFNDIVPKSKASLPMQIGRFVDVVFEGYAEVIGCMDAKAFISTTFRSMRLRSRQAMETCASQ